MAQQNGAPLTCTCNDLRETPPIPARLSVNATNERFIKKEGFFRVPDLLFGLRHYSPGVNRLAEVFFSNKIPGFPMVFRDLRPKMRVVPYLPSARSTPLFMQE